MEKILLMVFPVWIPLYLPEGLPGNQLWFKKRKKQNNLENLMKFFKLLSFFWSHSSLFLDKHCLGIWPQMNGKDSL